MRVLLQFRGLHNDLRLAEFYSALSAVRNETESALRVNLRPAFSHLTGLPTPVNPIRGHAGSVLYGEIFFYADLKSEEEAKKLAQRSVLLRAIYKPIGHGNDYMSCVSSIDKQPFENVLNVIRDEQTKPSFRCHVEAFGKKLSVEQQLEKIHQFTSILKTFPGKVRMKDPEYQLWILEDAFPAKGHGKKINTEGPRQVFLALKISSGQGHIRESFSLKRRRYIGPTSMDAELSFVMANMARVQPGHLVNDPFCGTCSVLVSCAALGAITVASDINILTLRGKGKNKDIQSNFKQYNLPQPIGVLRADALHSPIRHIPNLGIFDAVVCDPPYGIKEGTRAFRTDVVDETHEKNHFQGTQRVRFSDFLHGVLAYAADVLVPNGRLVYWLPTTSEYRDEDVPTHYALQLVHNNVQPLTTRMSRRLITMRRLPQHEAEINKREQEKSRQLNSDNNSNSNTKENGNSRASNGHVPAHYDLACKLMRQPERAEDRLRNNNNSSNSM